MNLGEILIWESSNLPLLIPIGLVMLFRWLQGRAAFKEGLDPPLWAPTIHRF